MEASIDTSYAIFAVVPLVIAVLSWSANLGTPKAQAWAGLAIGGLGGALKWCAVHDLGQVEKVVSCASYMAGGIACLALGLILSAGIRVWQKQK